MKKTFVRILSCTLLAVILMTALVSCSSYGKVSKNFKDAGYTEITSDDKAAKISAELEDLKISCEAHVWQKKGDTDLIAFNCVVLEFKGEADIDKALADSETLKGLIEDAKKVDAKLTFVRGNCVLVPLSLLKLSEMVETFNK